MMSVMALATEAYKTVVSPDVMISRSATSLVNSAVRQSPYIIYQDDGHGEKALESSLLPSNPKMLLIVKLL